MTSVTLPLLALAAIAGVALERSLAVTFRRPISIFATLGLLLSAPIYGGSAPDGLTPAIVLATSSVVFAILVAGLRSGDRGQTFVLRGLVAVALAAAPTVFVLGQATWRRAYPEALMAALLGGQGLLYGGPLLWAGFFGLLGLRRKNRGLAHLCLFAVAAGAAGLVVGTENADTALRCATWLPFLAPGIAWSFAVLRGLAVRHPQRVITVAGLALVGWNALFIEQYRLLLIPNDNTASFARITANSAHLLSRAVGTPVAWPANWIFAARTGFGAEKWDAVAGRRLFPGPSAEDTAVEIGDDDSAFAPDLPLLGRGFGLRHTCGQGWCRDIYDRGRILLPLQNPGTGDLTIRVFARGEGNLRLTLDYPAAAVVQELSGSMASAPLRVAARLVKPGIHILTLEVEGGGKATLDRITLERTLGAASTTAPPG